VAGDGVGEMSNKGARGKLGGGRFFEGQA
jgi:hypothetical protein